MAEVYTGVYREIVDFIASRPSLENIAEFHFSEANDTRINDLLTANRTRRLTDAEAADLEEFGRIEHIMTMIKLTASLKLKEQTAQLEQVAQAAHK